MKSIPFADAEYSFIASFAHKNFGLNLTPSKKDMVYSRLLKRLRKLGLPDFASYLALLNSAAAGSEHGELLSALKTNVTQFFREKHHFDYLRDTVLPGLIARARAGYRVRLWSAGCSAGQEAYSMALTVLALCPEAEKLDLKILASDIDQQIIKFAKAATYPLPELIAIPTEYQSLVLSPQPNSKTFGFVPSVRKLISFAELNLIADWPFSGPFDVIFCRNVAIYFDGDAQSRLWHRFAALIPTDGHLFIGHSERVSGPATQVTKSVGVTVYRKLGQNAAV
jgi:chemotaxis protein methyltransferase CheR